MRGRIDHIGVVVADIAATRRLLEDVIGLDLKREQHLPGSRIDTAFLGFDDEGSLVELVQLGDPEDRLRRLGEGNVARLEHIAIEVEDVRAAREELQSRGVAMQTDEPTVSGPLRSYFTRPETTHGIVFQLFDRRVG
jgi:methylmalonyl-CoA/ethylmalonyl-CoA epimerase